MILRGSTKIGPFFNSIARTIAGGEPTKDIDLSSLTRMAIEFDSNGVIYLAAGYWRARPVWDDEQSDALIGVELINPDRTWEECRAVERGIAILRHYEYR